MANNMLGEAVKKIVDLPLEMIGVIYDLVEKLSGESGQEWLDELKKFLRKEKCWGRILKLISGNELLVLDAVDGSEILADAKDIFEAGIDPNFKNFEGASEKGPATKETQVRVYEMIKDGTSAEIFGELNTDIEKNCLTQHQIRNFIKKYRR